MKNKVMKRQMLIIDLHSFVDLITNSSSELFVCDTDKSLDAIKELLQDMLNLSNKCNGTKIKFEDAFGTIEFAEINIENMWSVTGYYSPSCLRTILNIYPPPNYDSFDHMKDFQQRWDELKKAEEVWLKEHGGQINEILKGKIFIHSAGSNSIPFELFDFIENTFNADRIHLG